MQQQDTNGTTAPKTTPSSPVPSLAVSHMDDQSTADLMRSVGYCGPRWDQLINDYADYAWGRLHSQIFTGKINEVAIGIRHPILQGGNLALLRDSTDHRDRLVTDALMWAPAKFREHLQRGRWDGAKGKSLRSYYFGTVVAGFWEAYRVWVAERMREAANVHAYGLDDSMGSTHYDPEERVAVAQALAAILSDASAEQRLIAAGLLHGATHAEIAADLRLASKRGVEVRLRPLRRRARALVAAGVIDIDVLPRTVPRQSAQARGAS